MVTFQHSKFEYLSESRTFVSDISELGPERSLTFLSIVFDTFCIQGKKDKVVFNYLYTQRNEDGDIQSWNFSALHNEEIYAAVIFND